MLPRKIIRVAGIASAVCSLCGPTAWQFALGDEPERTTQESVAGIDKVILLRDGGVLVGRVTESSGRYSIVRGGTEISIAATQVAAVCDTLQAAYLHQRDGVQNPSADAHLSLAEWCLRCELYPQAAQELLMARGLDPRHPRLELVERRLVVLGEPAAPNPSSPSSVRAADSRPPVANQEPPSMSDGELRADVVERFTRKVQPLLVNNCTANGCHRAGSQQSFELDRALLHGMANRRSTMRNLTAVLALVDHQRPQESPLLTIPRRDHGGLNRPIFGPRHSHQFQQLLDWVAMVTSQPGSDSEVTAGIGTSEPPTSEPVPPRWREPVEDVSYDQDGNIASLGRAEQREHPASTANRVTPATFDDASLPPLERSPVRYGVTLHGWRPKDAFDPEVFNRQTRRSLSQQSSAVSQD